MWRKGLIQGRSVSMGASRANQATNASNFADWFRSRMLEPRIRLIPGIACGLVALSPNANYNGVPFY